jgi:hypothetical protein
MAGAHLGVACATHDLPSGIADVVHAARGTGLPVAKLAACGVHREVTAKGQVVVCDELKTGALLAEARILEAQ